MKKILIFVIGLIFSIHLFSSEASAKKIAIGDSYSAEYEFIEKPKVGTSTIRIKLLDKNNKQVKDLKIIGSYDMPSMRGHHSSPPTTIQTNKQNVYLFPVNLVMRGRWEIVLSFQKDNKEIHKELITLDI
jgi:hypothetical protein